MKINSLVDNYFLSAQVAWRARAEGHTRRHIFPSLSGFLRTLKELILLQTSAKRSAKAVN